MQETFDYLKKTGVNFVATINGDKPSCRPFGDPFLYDGKIYCLTKKHKNVAKQILDNPSVCIVAYDGEDGWMRINCQLIDDSENTEAKKAALAYFDWMEEAGYTLDDPDFQLFFMQNAEVELHSDDQAVKSWSF